MKRMMMGVALGAIVFAGSAMADFSGTYAPAAWTLNTFGTPPAGDSTVDTGGAPGSIQILGGNTNCGTIAPTAQPIRDRENNLQGGAPAFPNSCYLEYGIGVPQSGTLAFTWNYETFDVDGPAFDLFGYQLNGTYVQLSDNGGTATQSGTEAVSVSAGDTFAFVFDCTDCAEGPADVTISGFSGPATPAVTSVPADHPAALMGLIAMMLLIGSLLLRSRS